VGIPSREPSAAKARLEIGGVETTALGSGGGTWLKTKLVTIIGRSFHGRRINNWWTLPTLSRRLLAVGLKALGLSAGDVRRARQARAKLEIIAKE
jgi:hypothetical protein